MNEETIQYRLEQIEKKLDTLTDILLQTQAQEIRLSNAEKAIIDLKKQKEKKVDMVVTPIVSAGLSGIIAWLLVKVGIK